MLPWYLARTHRQYSCAVLGLMRVLAHIHTFNDADIIDRTIEGVLRQTRPVDGILLVDNASTDGTLDRPSVRNTTVLRHSENLGTSGAVHSGFSFALQHGYDWIWVFDADSIPEPDALEKLLTLYSEWPSSQQNETAFLACRPRHQGNNQPDYRSVFSSRGNSSTPIQNSENVTTRAMSQSGPDVYTG